MTESSPIVLDIAQADARMRAGELSPRSLLDAIFARIGERDDELNAYVRLMRDSAQAEAAASEERRQRGEPLGPLDGMPIGVKDIFDTGGVLTTGGTMAFRDRVPAQDSTPVRRLREAGAVIVGKTNTHELALGGTTINPHYGPTRNPWHTERIPGGSSGGSAAAVAAGMCLAALGTDTAGSIRIPSAFCALSGHKPTYGLVGRGGVIPLSLTLDHAGPLARSARDCALLLNALAGYDERDHDSVDRPAEDFSADIDAGVQGLRLAVIPSFVEEATPAVLEHFERALDVLRDLGAEITTAEPMAGESDWRAPLNAITVTEGASYIESILRERPETIGERVRRRMLGGLEVMGTQYARALQWRKEVQARFERTLAEQRIDAYVTPTSPVTARPFTYPEVDTVATEWFRNTRAFDNTHQPSLSIPMGFDEEGLPSGLMISGALWSDALVLRIGHAYQQATDHHRRRPPM